MRYRLLGSTLLMLLVPTMARAAVTCTASATAVAFGVYNPFFGSPLDTTGTVTVTCSTTFIDLVSYTVSLSRGGGSSYAGRRMNSGSNLLSYQLYTDAARSQIWGDGSGGTSTNAYSGILIFTPITNTHTVYGRIPAAQTTVIPGSYTDTITVTVSY
jgi:spore coat protein U-like protein